MTADLAAGEEAKYSVAVIGAGNIAAAYDSPGDHSVLTHLHAIAVEPRLRCVGLFDLDRAKAQRQAARWAVPFASDLDRLFATPVDVAVVAVPDEAHAGSLMDLLGRKVRLVLCEKPLATDSATSRAIVEAYAGAGRPLMVNYQRRFESTLMALKRRLDTGELGRPIGGAVWYSKGLLHNGSHAVDLLRYLFGDVREASARRRVVDYHVSDPTVSGTLVFDQVAIELIGGDERMFSLFEVDLLFEKARYRYVVSGLRLERHEVRPDPLFPGYVEMQCVESGPTQLGRALVGCYRAIVDFLDGSSPLAFPAADVIATQEVCEALQTLPFDRVWRRTHQNGQASH